MKHGKKLVYLVLVIAVLVGGMREFGLVSRERYGTEAEILFLVLVVCLAVLLVETLLAVFKAARPVRQNARLLTATVLLLLSGFEMFLRFGTDRYLSYRERTESRAYVSAYSQVPPSWFHTWTPNTTAHITRSEFEYTRQINSLGIPEKEPQIEKAPTEFRIIALGDSFTEGVGTTYDSSWVRVAERDLSAAFPGRQINAINAGVSGSDPFYGYVLLRERLLELSPDLVIALTNGSDISDVQVRGGLERFQPDRKTVFRKGPRWEWMYAVNFTTRFVVHRLLGYNYLLLKRRDSMRLGKESVRALVGLTRSYSELAAANGFDLLVVAQPDPHESATAYGSGMQMFVDSLARAFATVPSQRVTIGSFDLQAYFRQHELITRDNLSGLAWRRDGHFNGSGYAIMGHAIARAVLDGGFVESTVPEGD